MFALFARTFLFQAFEVPSPSMEKTVLTGDRLVVNKFVYARAPARRRSECCCPARPSRRGDVVVFRFPEDPRRDFIKRVVALPGETVAIRDKRVYVDGRPLAEPYAFHADDAIWPDDPAISEAHRRRDQLAPTARARRRVLRHGRQPRRLERQPLLGPGARRPHRGPRALRVLVGPPALLRRAERPGVAARALRSTPAPHAVGSRLRAVR